MIQAIIFGILSCLAICQPCPPGENLFEGQCYKIIPGCFTYLSINQCKQCVVGFYKKSDGLCARQGTQQQTTSNQNQQMNDQIKNNTRLVHEYNLNKHPEIKGQAVGNIKKLDTWKGQYIIIDYYDYRITSFIDHEGAIVEIFSGVPINDLDSPYSIIQQIKKQFLQLERFTIYDIKFLDGNYEIDLFYEPNNQIVHLQVARQQLNQDFSNIYNIGYFSFGQILQPYVQKYLESIDRELAKQRPEISEKAQSKVLNFKYSNATVSAMLGTHRWIINQIHYDSQIAFRYFQDQNFLNAYFLIKSQLPFKQMPPIKTVRQNQHSNGTKLFIISYTAANQDYMIPIDYQLVIEYFGQTAKLVSLRINFQYVLEEITRNNNSKYIQIAECYSYKYIGAYCQRCGNYYEYLNDESVCYTVLGIKCAEFDQVTKQCLRCISGYDLNQNKQCEILTIDFPYCQIVVNKTCIKCNQGYIQNGLGGCKKLDPLCLMTSQQNTCQICVPNYIVTPKGSCIRQVAYCENYTENGCDKCQTGFVLLPTLPYETCNRFIRDQNCLNYDSNNHCTVCHQDYLLSRFKFCYKKLQHCLSYNDETGQCQYCDSGYRIYDEQCVSQKSPQIDCLSQIQYRHCQQCARGFPKIILDFGKCQCEQGYQFKNNACLKIINNCLVVDLYTQNCMVCFQNYYQFGGRCHKPIEHCNGYTKQGQCIGCQNGRRLQFKDDRMICV